MNILLSLALLAAAQDPRAFESRQPKLREQLVKEGGGSGETEAALGRALRWLEKAQKPDGSWESPEDDYVVGMTGLAILAFLGSGQSPASPEFGTPVRNGVKYLLSVQDPEGCIGARGYKYVLNHAIATTALAEALTMSDANADRKPAQKAVDFLTAAQNPGLGWRYTSRCGDNDTSVTTWAALAFYSAEQPSLTFKKANYVGAIAWLDKITDADGRARYIPNPQAMSPGPDEAFDVHPTPTAMGMISRLFITGVRKSPPLEAGIKILAKDLPRWGKTSTDYCYWYFGSLALFKTDGPSGEIWKAWNEALKPALLQNQVVEGKDAGSWDPVDRWSCFLKSRVYATAINALTLETYYRYVKFFRGQEK